MHRAPRRPLCHPKPKLSGSQVKSGKTGQNRNTTCATTALRPEFAPRLAGCSLSGSTAAPTPKHNTTPFGLQTDHCALVMSVHVHTPSLEAPRGGRRGPRRDPLTQGLSAQHRVPATILHHAVTPRSAIAHTQMREKLVTHKLHKLRYSIRKPNHTTSPKNTNRTA